jgi:2-amino-4-hydroxy-6-hydroxymethyldihydropteridine diphosphokinase
MSRSFLALGSNLGNRQAYLDFAILRLRAEPGVTVRRVSSYFETSPVGGPAGQGAYLNAVAEIETLLSPDRLLRALLQIEEAAGRVRSEPNAPRTLDLDILLYDHLVRSAPNPILPHPRMHERRFVLEPLAEIAPETIHPVYGRSISALLAALPPTSNPPRKHLRALLGTNRELAGLRAVVTGSTSGIGRAIALEFACAGADVLIHGRRSDTAIQDAVNELTKFGVNARGVRFDLHEPAARAQLIEAAWGAWGGIDVWVNNAGADLLTGEAANWSFEQKWAELVAVDLTATMVLSRMAGERMRAGCGGVIINIGWDQADTGMEGESGQLFGSVKAGVMAFTRSLALTLAPKVRVNCIAPGWIKTAWGESASEAWQDRVRRETPLGRWGLPEDVATAARWLASPVASFITGQTIRVNGGAVR